MNIKLLIVSIFLVLALPNVSAFCVFGFGDCSREMFLIQRDVNQTVVVNDVNGVSNETFNAAFPISFDQNVTFDSNIVLDGRYVKISELDANIWNTIDVAIPWQDVNVANDLTIDWNGLQNYPDDCPAGQVVKGVGDTLTCVTAATAAGQSFSLFFIDGDLDGDGVLNINHDLNTGNIGIHIYDDLNFEVVPDQVLVTDVNNVNVTLASFQTIPNTWNAVVLNTGGSDGGTGDSNAVGFTQTFVNGDLSSGVLTVTHSLSKQYPQYQVVDNNNAPVFPDDLNFLTSNTLNFDVDSFTPIVGTWRIVLDASH